MQVRGDAVRRSLTAVVTVLAASLLLASYLFPRAAEADHQPADKVVARGATIDQVDDATPILVETMRVSTVSDLVLSVTAECSILTELLTGGTGSSDMAEATGRVELWVEIDGTPVPVSGAQGDDGKVVFCDRTYSRSVTDREGDDQVDEEEDFIRTRAANAFNWVAFDVGRAYDNPAIPAGAGNNIVQITVMAEYTTATMGRADADAFVGKRTLVVEPTKASVHEGT